MCRYLLVICSRANKVFHYRGQEMRDYKVVGVIISKIRVAQVVIYWREIFKTASGLSCRSMIAQDTIYSTHCL